MKISGFTMVRNAEKFYFPVKESIESILPIVDEFIVALGDSDDATEALIRSINSDKIKIYPRVWSEEKFKESLIFAEETNFAMSQCTGDWCFYIQADEVIHEQDLNTIKKACEENLDRKEVDALLFKYNHFWGDYDHYLPLHSWYKNEMRVVRNNAGIYSFKDAQSFRKNDNQKLNAKLIDAYVYHYGWVRPPEKMIKKKTEHDSIHHGKEQGQKMNASVDYFDYGLLYKIPKFKGTHPRVMENFIKQMNWKDKLSYKKSDVLTRPKLKHELLKYRVLSWVENTFFNSKEVFGGYKNWNEIK